MNTRQRTKLRYMCKHMDFANFNLMDFLTTDSVPGRKESIKKKYITLVMRNHRKWKRKRLRKQLTEKELVIGSIITAGPRSDTAFFMRNIRRNT